MGSAIGFNLLLQVLYSVTMLRTFGMYLKSDDFQSMREEIWTSWNHVLKLCITLRLKIIKQECPKELRSSNSAIQAIRLVPPTENGTFQDNASKLFNNLPETIRNCKDYRTFLRLSRNFLRNRVQSDYLVLLDSVNSVSTV